MPAWGAQTLMYIMSSFLFHILAEHRPNCHLEALNTVIVIRLWEPQLAHKLVHLFSDNATVVSIFQVGRGRDEFIQACAREVRITCATWDITKVVGHIPGTHFSDTADA